MTRRLVSAALLGASALYFVDLFLRWSSGEGHGSLVIIGQLVGWDVSVAATSAPRRSLSRRRGRRDDGGVAVARAAARVVLPRGRNGTGVLAVAAVLNVRWGGSYDALRFGRFAAGAWIALALGIVLLACAALRLAELRASRAG